MGVCSDRIHFDGPLPDQAAVLAEFRNRAGAPLLAELSFHGGKEVLATTALGARARPYMLQILVEHGGTLLEYTSGLPSGEILPVFARVPWRELPWPTRVEAMWASDAELFPEEVWTSRLRPRPLEWIMEDDPDAATTVASTVEVPISEILQTLHSCDEQEVAHCKRLLGALLALSCDVSDAARRELGTAALSEVPVLITRAIIPEVARRSVDFSRPELVRALLEALAVVAYDQFLEMSEEIAEGPFPESQQVASQLLRESRGA